MADRLLIVIEPTVNEWLRCQIRWRVLARHVLYSRLIARYGDVYVFETPVVGRG